MNKIMRMPITPGDLDAGRTGTTKSVGQIVARIESIFHQSGLTQFSVNLASAIDSDPLTVEVVDANGVTVLSALVDRASEDLYCVY